MFPITIVVAVVLLSGMLGRAQPPADLSAQEDVVVEPLPRTEGSSDQLVGASPSDPDADRSAATGSETRMAPAAEQEPDVLAADPEQPMEATEDQQPGRDPSSTSVANVDSMNFDEGGLPWWAHDAFCPVSHSPNRVSFGTRGVGSLHMPFQALYQEDIRYSFVDSTQTPGPDGGTTVRISIVTRQGFTQVMSITRRSRDRAVTAYWTGLPDEHAEQYHPCPRWRPSPPANR